MICKCGHPESHHEFLSTFSGIPGDSYASWCAGPDMKCDCDHFTPDNLNTIEYEAKKRNLI